MSAPLTEPFSSVSSSGHVDGLGRRTLAFDRETGAILERLYLRPELAAFEQIVRRRVAQLSTLQEERFARPTAVERDPATGELVIVAEFITGGRLSELLEVSADAAVVPGVDVALGYLVEALPALAILHASKRVVHGLIDPSRTILTEEGQVVFLDAALGPAVELLHLSPPRLWAEFGVATSGNTGRVTFDAVGDVTQAALSALMLVLGRNLQPHEYPDALPSLLMEVIDVAQIRGTSNFASGLQRFMQRALPLPGRRAFASADEALSEVRQLVRRDIGLDVCRQAVVDFVAQMDASFVAHAHHEEQDTHTSAGSRSSRVPELDRFLETFKSSSTSDAELLTTTAIEEREEAQEKEVEEEDSSEREISLDHLEPVAAEPDRQEIYDLSSLDETGTLSTELASLDEYSAPLSPELPSDPELELEPEVEPEPALGTVSQAAPVEEASFDSSPEASVIPPAPVPEPAPAPSAAPAPEVLPNPEPVLAAQEPTPQATEEADAEKESGSARRRKRQQQKSARARKDKLRSTTADQKMPPPPPAPPPPPPKPATPSGWLVQPHRAGSESLFPEPIQTPPPPQPVRHAPPPTVSFAPTPVGQLPQPTYATPAVPVYGTPSVIKPQPPPLPTPPVIQPVTSGQVKVKPDSLPPVAPRKPVEPEIAPFTASDRFTTLSLGRPQSMEETGRAFPWRLAAVAIAVATVAILMGRTYLPGRTAVVGEPGAPVDAPTQEPASTPLSGKPETPIPAGRGRINIQTQPPGLRVLLDRKLVGETPLLVDAAPGRRVLTFMTSGGEVIHTVRVVAGKTVNLDIPVFSGWVSVIAPIVLNISEDGRSMGTTEQNRLMLPPGRHRLALSNPDFGYNSVHEVDVEPGAVRSITIDAKGTANLNAQPWAEVWLDGSKLGDTPLASAPVPLGLREFVFKHPELGERRVSATIRANTPTVVTVDFTK